MAVRLTHIVDESTDEDGLRLLSLLLASMPRDRVEQRVVVIGRAPTTLAAPEGVQVSRLGRRFKWPVAWLPALQRLFAGKQPDVLYAWGTGATLAVAGRCDPCPILTIVSDPADAREYSQWWHGAGGDGRRTDVLCSSKLVQRRLVEAGVAIAATAVVRPGVDFAPIARVARTRHRADIGLPPEGRVLLTASPPSRPGGQYYAVWATAILYQIWPDVHLVIPGTSREQKRLRRFIERIYCPEVYRLTGDRYAPAELLALSDMLIVPAVGDIPTSWLPWAMAASVPIVGSAVPAVAELVTDLHNGFLCRPAEPHTLAACIRAAADSGNRLRQCVETARRQAFELFRVQRCVDEHFSVIDNLVSGGRAVGTLQDAASRA